MIQVFIARLSLGCYYLDFDLQIRKFELFVNIRANDLDLSINFRMNLFQVLAEDSICS